tara:strand:+ start:1572 stop:1814 length:243 start_codon:yes stop_codon:yes gene_type:complete
MENFDIHKVGYRGRMVMDKQTGLLGVIRDKFYSGLYEISLERNATEHAFAIDNSKEYPLEEQMEWPTKTFRKADQLTLID